MQNFRSRLKNCAGLFRFNFKPIVLFGLISTILSCVAETVVQRVLTMLAMKFCGISYLVNNTIGKYLTSPFSWAAIAVNLLIAAYLSLICICALIFAFQCSKFSIKVNIQQLYAAGVDGAYKVFKRKNFGVVLYILIIFPLLGSVEAIVSAFSLGLPGFILDVIFSQRILTLLLLAAAVFLIILAVNLAMSVPVFMIEDANYPSACRKSSRMMKGKRLRYFGNMLALGVGIAAFTAVCGGLIFLISDILGNAFSSVLPGKIGILVFMLICLTVLFFSRYIVICFTSNWYFENAEDEIPTPLLKKRKLKVAEKVTLIIDVVITLLLTLYMLGSSVIFAHTDNVIPAIAAHRGDSVRAPENSMPAFKLAIEEGISKWIELDVHQTKDGVIVVSHDDYLGKIGIDRYVHESTYEELMQYDSGAYFSDEYKGLRLCTLKEALELAKNKVSVQIEIKPTEYDDHIEEAVVDIIRDVNSILPNAVLSLSDVPLKRIKEFAPDIITIYCTVIASEGIEDIEYADWFSVEESNISDELVQSIHYNGKKCFAWTVNSESSVQDLVDMGVDVILTDDPIMMRNALLNCNYTESFFSTVENFARRFYEMISQLIE